jgi:hypothetical protein
MSRSISSLWVTVGVTTADEGEALYCGFDFAAAQSAMLAAGSKFAVVGILPHGVAPVKVRRPAPVPAPATDPKPVFSKSKKST